MDARRERSLDRSADDALARDRGRDLKRPHGADGNGCARGQAPPLRARGRASAHFGGPPSKQSLERRTLPARRDARRCGRVFGGRFVKRPYGGGRSVGAGAYDSLRIFHKALDKAISW